jgi:hypothetical protein
VAPGAILVAGRRVFLADIAVAAWVALWLAVAVVVGIEVSNLRVLGDTIVVASDSVDDAARALERTSDALDTTRTGLRQTQEGLAQIQSALEAIGSIPFVGTIPTDELADVVRALEDASTRLQTLGLDVQRLASSSRVTAASARESGRDTAESTTLLAVLLALAIALIPTVTMLVAYLPRRRAHP